MPLGGLLTLGASAALPAIGGLVGNAAASGSRDAATAAQQAALQQYLGIDAPTAQQLMATYQKEGVVGTLTPAQQATVTQGQSAMQGVTTDPALRQAQMSALSQLQNLGNTGLTSADRMALQQVTNQTNNQANAMNKSILANAAQRGQAGSGMSLAAQLMASQNSANSGAQQGLNIAAQAQQKALQAMSNAGALGSQLEGQQFGEAAQKAAAADAIARFNAANSQNVIGQNTNSQNSAQQYNLTNAQNVANQNTTIANNQANQNIAAQQEAYNDAISKAKGVAGAEGDVAKQDNSNATNTANMYSGLGQGLGGVAGALGDSNAFNSLFTKNPAPNNSVAANSSPSSTVTPSDSTKKVYDIYGNDPNAMNNG